MSRKILFKVLKRIVKNIGLHNIGYVITALIKNLMQSTWNKSVFPVVVCYDEKICLNVAITWSL